MCGIKEKQKHLKVCVEEDELERIENRGWNIYSSLCTTLNRRTCIHTVKKPSNVCCITGWFCGCVQPSRRKEERAEKINK